MSMKTIFNRGFQGNKAATPAGQPVQVMRAAAPTFGAGAPPAPVPQPQSAPAAPARGVAQPLPGRGPVPVIKKGSGGPSCPVCRG